MVYVRKELHAIQSCEISVSGGFIKDGGRRPPLPPKKKKKKKKKEKRKKKKKRKKERRELRITSNHYI